VKILQITKCYKYHPFGTKVQMDLKNNYYCIHLKFQIDQLLIFH